MTAIEAFCLSPERFLVKAISGFLGVNAFEPVAIFRFLPDDKVPRILPCALRSSRVSV